MGTYTVARVEPHQVILKGDSGEIHLKLYDPQVKRRKLAPPPKVASPTHFKGRKNTAFSKPTIAKKGIKTSKKTPVKKVGTRNVPVHPKKPIPPRRSSAVPSSSPSQHPTGRPAGTSRYRR